ncbi:nucleophile aminohydrolase [Mycena pura]|uniref:Nucleophile aminohydrolase n=1 Tax=Mycena pura TaxID=153505 RepID=A0AAD6VRV9_9AGAR|nr:nucleophile aminohydrolase [Mycena pura]
MSIYIVAHGGAGLHSKTSERDVRKALQKACNQALCSTSENASALSAVENAISFLEDSSLLNAGCGSNLTLDGTVECDAAIMDGQTCDYGSVGAVSGVKNPIRLARRVLEHSRVPDYLGRIPPLTLVSAGAHAFARSAHVQLVPPESLITPRAQRQWETWKHRLDSSIAVSGLAKDSDADVFQDTVGAVAWNAISGEIASGVSSGGILLKYPGRIGEAAVFGAGCWAQALGRRSKFTMACSVSGAGEYIMKASLARSISNALEKDVAEVDVHEVLQRTLVDDFWIPSRSASNPDPSAGVILLTTDEDDNGRAMGRLWCAFTTPSMAIAYASSENPHGKALILRRPKVIEARSNDHARVFVTGFTI